MKLPEYGVFSPTTLMIFSSVTGEPAMNLLKRALILFDKLVFFPVGLGDITQKDHFLSKEFVISRYANATRRELKYICPNILLDRDLFQDDEKIYEEIYSNDKNDLWGGQNTDKYIKFVDDLVEKQSEDDMGMHDKWEEKKFYVANINFEFKLFKVMNKYFEQCSGFFTELHEAAALATFGNIESNPEKTLRILTDINIFDFASLHWKDIFTLRKDQFAQDFRSFIAEWSELYRDNPTEESFQGKISAFIENSNYDFIEKNTPKISRTILSGIASNIPLPLPVNPIGILNALKTTKDEIELKNKFGWLFFIQRARGKMSNNALQGT